MKLETTLCIALTLLFIGIGSLFFTETAENIRTPFRLLPGIILLGVGIALGILSLIELTKSKK